MANKNARQIYLNEKALRNIVREVVKRVLTEGMSHTVYHYTSMENLLKMLKKNSMFFNSGETDNNKNGMLAFSTTRNRNSVQGYPYMMSGDYSMGGGTKHNSEFGFYFIRLELDGDAIQNLSYEYKGKRTALKGGPYDYIYHANKDDEGTDVNSRHEIANMAQEYTADDEEGRHQPFSQAEDRVFSKKKSVVGLDNVMKRIDVLIRLDKIYDNAIYDGFDKDIVNFIKQVLWLKRSRYADITHVYTNRNHFDHQTDQEVSYREIEEFVRRLI